jgi:hypothetical protein
MWTFKSFLDISKKSQTSQANNFTFSSADFDPVGFDSRKSFLLLSFLLCGRACLLLPSHLQDWSLYPGVQGEGEGGAEGEGEVKGLALAGQRLAIGQTLGCQRGGHFITHCGFDYPCLSKNQIVFWESITGHVAIIIIIIYTWFSEINEYRIANTIWY